jgi:hypothetical protein
MENEIEGRVHPRQYAAKDVQIPDLRRAKANRHILARPSASSISFILQVFFDIPVGSSSATY